MDSEHLHFDIDEDDLLDDSEGVYMVHTWFSSLHELFVGTISRDADVKKNEASDSTQHFLS